MSTPSSSSETSAAPDQAVPAETLGTYYVRPRRAVNYVAFIAVGAALGLVAGVVLNVVGPAVEPTRAASTGPFLAFGGALLGALIGAGIGVLLDRR